MITYPKAKTDRAIYPVPVLAAPAVGGSVVDPVFGTPIRRITGPLTLPENPNCSFATPSGPNQLAWSADSKRFYLLSSSGEIVPFSLDPVTGISTRGDILRGFYMEPTFSYVTPGILYGASSAQQQTIRQYDFATGAYSDVMDLRTTMPNYAWADTYIGAVNGSAGAERLIAFYGGRSQDDHRFVVVFDRANAGIWRMLDADQSFGVRIHNALIDRSGRFVNIYPTAGDTQRTGVWVYVWDLQTLNVTPLTDGSIHGGHDSYGYAQRVNNAEGHGAYDDVQWQFHADLASPDTVRDLVVNRLTPQSVGLTMEHSSWHNARPDAQMPFLTSISVRPPGRPWRAYDGEILAVETDGAAGQDAVISRMAHHRSDVTADNDPGRYYFWYSPRVQVSPDGRYVAWTSNWQKTLGKQGGTTEAGGGSRFDVFVADLQPDIVPPIDPPIDPPVDPVDVVGPDVRIAVLHPIGRSGKWEVRADSAATDIATMVFSVNGRRVTTITIAPYAMVLDLRNYRGDVVVKAVATDRAGNTGTASRTLVIA